MTKKAGNKRSSWRGYMVVRHPGRGTFLNWWLICCGYYPTIFDCRKDALEYAANTGKKVMSVAVAEVKKMKR